MNKQCFQFDLLNSIYIIEDVQFNEYLQPLLIYYKIFKYKNIIKLNNNLLFIKDENNKNYWKSYRLTGNEWNILIQVNSAIKLGKINQDLAFDKNWNLTTNKKDFKHFLR